MAKGSYGRSFLWYLAFFGLPVAAFVFSFVEVANWANPIWGPQVATEKKHAAEQARIEQELEKKQADQADLQRRLAAHQGDGAEKTTLESKLQAVEAEKRRIEAERTRIEEEKPRARAQAEEREKSIQSVYKRTTVILALLGAFPYLVLLLALSERLRITDESIRQMRLFRSRRVVWDNVIECRDFLNYIHLVPADRSSEMYIDYYQTFHRHGYLWRLITSKCREAEANMMVGRRRGRVASCDLGLVPSFFFIAGAAVALVFFRQRIVLLGALSGIVLALVGAWLWITTRLSPRTWKSGGFSYATLFALALILPPAYFAQEIYRVGNQAFAIYGALYFLGLLGGSGLVSVLLPSRKRG